LWRTRQWDRLLALIERLPAKSHFHSAILTDEDYLHDALSRQPKHTDDDDPGYDRVGLTRWTPEVRVLADLVDELRALRATVVAVAGGPAKEPSRYDRPRTALDKVRFNLSRERHEKLVNRILPDRTE